MTDLKTKLKNREFVKGTHSTFVDSSITELYGNVGFDFIWIDTEHTAIELYTLENHLIAARAAGTNSLVRIPWNDPVMAKRVLDMGPNGIIFPMVNTGEELDKAMKSTFYPPIGTRGFGPIRAANYGLDDMNEYISKKSLELIRCVQIETYIAVDNLEEMAKNPHVDCFIFGPCDLSGSVGELNQVFGKNTQDLIKRAVAILKKAGKSIGVSTGADDFATLKQWHDLGINLISAGTDWSHIAAGSKKVFQHLEELSH
jgi:2-dehydro-3-deoxyglucarate aldolase/4-hydroxy-2-oxoheptanedioate aldolase